MQQQDSLPRQTFSKQSTAYRCHRCTKLVRFSEYFNKTFVVDQGDHNNILDGHMCRKQQKGCYQ
jgi:hypothetical protein